MEKYMYIVKHKIHNNIEQMRTADIKMILLKV